MVKNYSEARCHIRSSRAPCRTRRRLRFLGKRGECGVLYNVFIAAEQNAVVWAVMNQIVFDTLAYAYDVYTRLIAVRPLAHAMYVIVCGSMSTWLKRLSVTSR